MPVNLCVCVPAPVLLTYRVWLPLHSPNRFLGFIYVQALMGVSILTRFQARVGGTWEAVKSLGSDPRFPEADSPGSMAEQMEVAFPL